MRPGPRLRQTERNEVTSTCDRSTPTGTHVLIAVALAAAVVVVLLALRTLLVARALLLALVLVVLVVVGAELRLDLLALDGRELTGERVFVRLGNVVVV